MALKEPVKDPVVVVETPAEAVAVCTTATPTDVVTGKTLFLSAKTRSGKPEYLY